MIWHQLNHLKFDNWTKLKSKVSIGNTWSWQGEPGSKRLAMARSTWLRLCCRAACAACSCTSAGRSAGCSSSPWCPTPASPATKPCNQTQQCGCMRFFWERGGASLYESFTLFAWRSFNASLLSTCFSSRCLMASFSSPTSSVSFPWGVSLQASTSGLYLKKHTSALHFPSRVIFLFHLAKAKKVGGSKVKGGGVGELWLEQGTNRNQQACLWTMEIM